MRYVIAIALNDIRVYLSDRGNVIGLLALPLIMTFVLGFAFSSSGSSATSLTVDVVDLDNTQLSSQFITDLRTSNSALILCPMDQTEDDVCGMGDSTDLDVDASITRVRDMNTTSLIVIPAGYSDAVQGNSEATIDYYSSGNVTTGDAVLPAVESVIQRINGSIVASRVAVGMTDALSSDTVSIFSDDEEQTAFADQVYADANTLWSEQTVSYKTVVSGSDEDESAGTQNGFGQSVPGMATMFVMMTVLGGTALIMRERKQWTLQRVAVMPVPKSAIIGGKILGRFILGIIQFVIVLAVGVVIGLNFGNDLLAILVVIVCYTLSITAVGMIFASFLENEMQANGLTSLVSIAFAGLGGAWWPLSVVPDFMRTIGHATPVAWAMDAFNKLIFENAGLGDILVEMAVLLVIAIVGFAIAVSAFKYE